MIAATQFQSPLFMLPPEVRVVIYNFIFEPSCFPLDPPRPLPWYERERARTCRRSVHRRQASALLACKLLLAECRPVLFANTTFTGHTSDADPKHISEKLLKVRPWIHNLDLTFFSICLAAAAERFVIDLCEGGLESLCRIRLRLAYGDANEADLEVPSLDSLNTALSSTGKPSSSYRATKCYWSVWVNSSAFRCHSNMLNIEFERVYRAEGDARLVRAWERLASRLV